MSRIPKSGKPLIKTTSTVTNKTATGGSKTTTTTKIRELQPCTYTEQNQPQTGGCQPCPSRTSQGGPSRLPQGTRGARPPSSAQPMPSRPMPSRGQTGGPPVPSRMMPPQAAMPRAQAPVNTSRQPCGARQGGSTQQGRAPPRRPPPPPVQMQPPMPGQYAAPAQYGPMSRAGKGMVYSSPAELRGQMEAKIPKEIKYDKVCPAAGARDRGALQGTAMEDVFAGNFNVYGGPTTSEEMVDRDVLNERVFILANMVYYR